MRPKNEKGNASLGRHRSSAAGGGLHNNPSAQGGSSRPAVSGRSYRGAQRPAQGTSPGSHAGSFQGTPSAGRPYVKGGAQPGTMPRMSGMPMGTEEIIRVRKKRSKHTKLKRALIVVGAVIVVLVGAAVGYGAWYTHSLASNMALDPQEQADLGKILQPASDNQQQPFYLLLVGSDKWENHGERSDAMVLVRIDPGNHQLTLVSVPRDTPYMLDGHKQKINQAFAEKGAVGAVTAVQQLTGVKISYYAEIDFTGLGQFVDSLGGIYVDVPYSIDYQVYTHDQPDVHINAGNQLLDGNECVALARMRTAYNHDEDAIRQSNVRAMVLSLLKTVLEAPPVKIPGLVQDLSKIVSTNMDLPTMVNLALDFSKSGAPTVYTCTGPYKGGIDPSTGLWLCYDNPEGWKTLMDAVNAGDNPQTAENTINGK